ncbi:hypothetical protein [Streptomyces poonensis]|uniref:Uncharacterized protein n=1 Tax=Streptomyces poonensis TaxID=68255 RepID=A0A918PRG3_9ACTN|nr:hypothetical protein [Streptomyces poonensis]GGZ20641.1 hypothetical protein GCM10010365_46190 [Streptomyces poonensis]
MPDKVRPWIRFIEEWDVGAPHADQLRAYVKEHGRLHVDYQAACIDVTEQSRGRREGPPGRCVNYRLHLYPAVHAIFASLPEDGRREVALLLVDALADPLAYSAVYGEGDGIMRTLARGRVTVAILVGHQTR